jgi:sugar phosphate permease
MDAELTSELGAIGDQVAPAAAAPPPAVTVSPARAWVLLGTLALGYMGIYLCRKNFEVANPLIRAEFGVSKERIGEIASASTLAYMVGKFTFGPVIDRYGGRACFLLALLGVAVFGASGAMAGSLGSLMLLYSLNRFAGSAGWGSMVKLVPDWFPLRTLPLAMAAISLSFVFGGVCAILLGGWIAHVSDNNWRWVMGGPALVLLAILGFCWVVLPRANGVASAASAGTGSNPGVRYGQIKDLLTIRQFWVVCALSFTLTLLRETFNTWTVDFFKTEGGAALSSQMAAFLSTPFDALGAVGIVALGAVFGRVPPLARNRLLFAILVVLAGLIVALPGLAKQNLLFATVAVGLVGFLSYGPYSLLSGIMAVEIRGKEYVATVSGMVDGTGYLAGILAGQEFGRVLDVGGYALAFPCLAVLALISAVLCLFLYSRHARPEAPTA